MSVFYERLAPWYDAYNEAIGKDAAREVAALVQVLADHDVKLGSVLDVACGTGRHLVHLREHATEVAGSDVSASMLAVAADRLPEVPLHEADFRELALGRTFDLVTCLFSSIGHVADADDLDRAIAAMADHVAPGGTLVVEPWLTPEVVVEDGMRDAAGVSVGDAAVSRTSRSWVEDDVVVLDWVWALATRDDVETFRERLRMPVFSRQRYLDSVEAAGLAATWVEHDTFPRGLVLGRRGRP